jgi:hypothetical protein
MGSRPPVGQLGVDAILTPAVRFVDTLVTDDAVKQASGLLPGGPGMRQRQRDQLPPSQQPRAGQPPASPGASDLQRLLQADLTQVDPWLLKQLDDKVTDARASRGEYSKEVGDYNPYNDDDDDVVGYEHVPADRADPFYGEADMPGDEGWQQ